MKGMDKQPRFEGKSRVGLEKAHGCYHRALGGADSLGRGCGLKRPRGRALVQLVWIDHVEMPILKAALIGGPAATEVVL